jgi:hypothetical protein
MFMSFFLIDNCLVLASVLPTSDCSYFLTDQFFNNVLTIRTFSVFIKIFANVCLLLWVDFCKIIFFVESLRIFYQRNLG